MVNLLTLAGKNIRLTIPASVLEKVGHIPGTEDLQKICEKFFASKLQALKSGNSEQMEKYVPYMSDVMFLPIILRKMIEQNTTLQAAIANSSDEISAQVMEMTMFFKMAELDSSLNTFMNGLIDSLFDAVSNIEEKDESMVTPHEISINLPDISNRTVTSLSMSGATYITGMFHRKPEVTEAINALYVTPFTKAVVTVLTDSPLIEELSDKEKKELMSHVRMVILDASKMIPLESVLSIALTKAIADDITLAGAISAIGSDELIKQATDKILNCEDFSKYEKEMQQITESLLLAMQQVENFFN